MDVQVLLARMEFPGVLVDANLLRGFSSASADYLKALEHKAKQRHNITNIQSTLEQRRVLYDELHLDRALPVRATPKGAKSVDSSTLAAIVAANVGNVGVAELPTLILEHRRVKKIVSTYCDGLLEHIKPGTSKIFPQFHQTGTATGRLSCSKPNIQTIPSSTISFETTRKSRIMGRQAQTHTVTLTPRCAIMAAPAHVLLSVDFKQIELRLLLHYSLEPEILQIVQQVQPGKSVFEVYVHIRLACARPHVRTAMQ